MKPQQLRLVTDPAPGFGDLGQPHPRDPVRAIFEHWLYMLGRSPRRCKLDPTRSAAIASALAIGFDIDVLLLAVDGMAADPLDGCGERQQACMREVEWLMARAARIERWADIGERLHAAQSTPPPPPAEPARPVDLQAEQQHREALRLRAKTLREGLRDAG